MSSPLHYNFLIVLQPTGLHLIFNLPLSKLYTNSLMSSLNSRAGWKYGTGIGKGLNPGGSTTSETIRQGVHLSGENRVSLTLTSRTPSRRSSEF